MTIVCAISVKYVQLQHVSEFDQEYNETSQLEMDNNKTTSAGSA